MAKEFAIHRIISENRKKGKACITVMFEGRSVTRHVQNWMGRHPDDTLQKQYDVRKKSVVEYTTTIANIEAVQAKLAPGDDQMRPLTEKLVKYKLALMEVSNAYETFVHDNPLQVEYYMPEQGAGE